MRRQRPTRVRSAPTSEVEKAYFQEQETVYDVDEGAWKSDAFWAAFSDARPGWDADPELGRFRGFVKNLRTEPPGVDLFMDNRQQLLSQYVYPGLGEDGDSADVHRSARAAASRFGLSARRGQELLHVLTARQRTEQQGHQRHFSHQKRTK